MSSNIKVIVRVRPSLSRETSECLVDMPSDEPGYIYLDHPKGKKRYVFDESIWSCREREEGFDSNSSFYRKCGSSLLEHLYFGYNVCLLAYGQTGSGKTHTMIGTREDFGLIPLMVQDILRHRDILIEDKINCQITFSYVEVYNEKVKDLLQMSKVCRVREDPILGPYIQDLTELKIESFNEFLKYLEAGNSLRTTASTKMNDSSSRSHAILTFSIRQTKFSDDQNSSSKVGEQIEEMISNVKLVDLAGSERLVKTQVFSQSDRLKEGTQINKSLTVLGRCINILSRYPSGVVPYRDSILTYLLKENLSGNSRTSMIFCISPTDIEETHQTLNYAAQVKKIKTKAKPSSLKISTSKVDWTDIQSSYQSLSKTLRQEIKILSDQLKKSQMGDLNKNISSWVKCNSREIERQSFEIKYFKKQLQTKSKECKVLHSHREVLASDLRANYRAHFVKNQIFLSTAAQRIAERCKDIATQVQQTKYAFQTWELFNDLIQTDSTSTQSSHGNSSRDPSVKCT